MKFKLLQQIVVMSRYAFVGIIVQACLSSLLLATNSGLAQRSVDNVHLGFRVEKANLVEIFDLIEEKTDFEFAYKIKDVRGKRSLSMEFENETLGNILRYISKNSDLTFRRVNNQIIAKKAEEGFSLVEEEILSLSSKEVDISGKITDETGEGLPGASVIEKGTTNGTTTDLDGNYRLNLPENATLVISFVGYKTTEVLLNGRSTIDVQMELDAEQLEEIVVVGYGERGKKSLTGAIEDVEVAPIQQRSASNLVEAMQGAVPGLVVTRRSGDPGEERTNFQIRGMSSINNTPPLLVIDDIPFPDHQVLSTLNPNDIEQFSVLKDAAAASLYGARAAGGVILITTKNGNVGGTKVNYQGKVSFETLGMEFQPTSQADYYRMYDEGNVLDGLPNHRYKYGEQWFLNGNNGEATFPPNVPFFDALDFTYADRDFVEEMWKDVAVSQYHNIGITGGSDKSTYNLTFGYLDRNGMQSPAENSYKRANVRFNYDVSLTDKLNMSTSVYIERGIKDKSSLLDAVFAPNGNSTYWHTMPTIAQFNSKGDVYGYGGTTDPINELLNGGRSKNINTKLNTTMKLQYRINDNLSVVGLTGINYWNDFFESNTNVMTYYNWPGTIVNKNNPSRNSTTKSYGQTLFQNYSGYINYNRQLGAGHNFTALLGTSYEKSEYDGFSAWRRDLISEELQSLQLGDPDEQYNDSNANGWGLASFFGRLNYSYNDRYLLEVNLRRDGSSRFVPSKRWDTFGGVSAGWNITEEDFFSASGIDVLKLRTSYGVVGNQSSIGLYDFIQLINASSGIYPFGATQARNVTASLGGLASEERTWERISNLNFGLDFSLLDSKLSGSFDYFKKWNKNMLVNIAVAEVLGSNPPTSNYGELTGNGWEASLLWQDNKQDFSYQIGFNISDNKNTVTNLAGANIISARLENAVEGYPMRSLFGYTREGLIKSQAELDAYTQLDGVPSNLRIGDAKYADLNNDGRISVYDDEGNLADVKLLGVENPRFSFGFNTGFKWKNLDFSAFFTGWLKHDIQRTSRTSKPLRNWWHNNNSFYVNKTFNSETRPDAEFPALSANGSIIEWNYRYQDFLVWNNSFVRLKNITVGYTFPKAMLSKMRIAGLRVYVNADDIWEWANASDDGRDPERDPSWDGGIPLTRKVSVGINANF